MIRRVRVLSAFLLTVVLIMPASGGTYNAELDVRNTVDKFEHALKKSDIAAMAKLVTPDFVAFENGEIKSWRPESDHSAMADLPRLFPARGSKIERVEVSCDLAWAYRRAEVRDTGAVVNQPHLVMATIYVLRQKSHSWKIAALSWSVSPQSHTDSTK